MKVVRSKLGDAEFFVETTEVQLEDGALDAKGPPDAPKGLPKARDIDQHLKQVNEILRTIAEDTAKAFSRIPEEARPRTLEFEVNFSLSGGVAILVNGSANAAIRAKATWNFD